MGEGVAATLGTGTFVSSAGLTGDKGVCEAECEMKSLNLLSEQPLHL